MQLLLKVDTVDWYLDGLNRLVRMATFEFKICGNFKFKLNVATFHHENRDGKPKTKMAQLEILLLVENI